MGQRQQTRRDNEASLSSSTVAAGGAGSGSTSAPTIRVPRRASSLLMFDDTRVLDATDEHKPPSWLMGAVQAHQAWTHKRRADKKAQSNRNAPHNHNQLYDAVMHPSDKAEAVSAGVLSASHGIYMVNAVLTSDPSGSQSPSRLSMSQTVAAALPGLLVAVLLVRLLLAFLLSPSSTRSVGRVIGRQVPSSGSSSDLSMAKPSSTQRARIVSPPGLSTTDL